MCIKLAGKQPGSFAVAGLFYGIDCTGTGMSDSSAFGFGKFIPGFDFLQNIGKAGTPSSGLPPFSHWVAPTVSIEEIEKRIEELKAVQFWLEQNGKALAATVQALEVQKMTLSTLKGMNVNFSEMAQAFPFATASSAAAASGKTEGNLSDWPMSAGAKNAEPSPPQEEAKPSPSATDVPAHDAASAQAFASTDAQKAQMATAMQWWGSLTQQFQQIAQKALQDPAQQQAILKATQMSTDFAKTAVKTASDMVRKAVVKGGSTPAKPATATKTATPTKASTTKKPPVKRATAAKKSTLPDKKAPSTVSKTPSVAAKKSTVSKARTR